MLPAFTDCMEVRAIKAQTPCSRTDLVVFSHLKWNHVFQRPHHLMSRFAKYRRVFFIEEASFDGEVSAPTLSYEKVLPTLTLVRIDLPKDLEGTARGNQEARRLCFEIKKNH